MRPRRDLRAAGLAVCAWSGALLGGTSSPVGLLCLGLTVGVLAVVAAIRSRPGVLAGLLVVGTVASMAGLRQDAVAEHPVRAWSQEGAVAIVVADVRADPVTREGAFGDVVVVPVWLRSLTVRGAVHQTRVPGLVLGDTAWSKVELGQRVRTLGRLRPAEDARTAALLTGTTDVVVLREPSRLLRAAARVRASVRHATDPGPEHADDLVPALVTGDDQALDPAVQDDFRTAGLTHLTAVSGTNLTLVLGSVLLLARWCRVSGRGLLLVGLLGVAGFVLVARPEPSVVRAAAMGTVALLGLGAGGQAAGLRAWGVAVLGLLVLDPWLAWSVGFALSALATIGILLLARPLRDSLARWLPSWAPGWLPEAVAVPVAAQLAVTPLLAALSGEVSMVAVAANLLVAPVVGPATVLGLAGGLCALVWYPLGAVLGWAAGWCALPIVVVAQRAADLPGASFAWPSGAAGLVGLTALTCLLAALAPWLARSPLAVTLVVLGCLLVLLQPLRHLGWPPPGWVLVMCDVGQGDALVLSLGEQRAVVVDAGPDAVRMHDCLARLDVRVVPAVVLTHFHADHVSGLPGVLEGRAVGEVQVTGLPEPREGAAEVRSWARAAGVPVRVVAAGERAAVGTVRWEVLRAAPTAAAKASVGVATSAEVNDASLVLLVRTRGLRVLLTGDVEPSGQAALARGGIGPVDVLKVPHHGSAHQDVALLRGLRARIALVSVGADNGYGHPDPEVLAELSRSGALVRRTDRHGDVAVVVDEGELRVVASSR